MNKIWAWLHSEDLYTWVGHGLQGLVIPPLALLVGLNFAAGVFAVLIHFLLREAPGIYFAAKANDTKKLRDGVYDFIAPVLGVWLSMVLFG